VLGELAEVFLGAKAVRQAKTLGVNHAVGQRDALGLQVTVDGRVGDVVPRLLLPFSYDGSGTFVVAFQQVIEFVQDDASGLISAHP
jgi:hypothetical protein